MAHKEQRDFFERLSAAYRGQFLDAKRILEVGSQNINGSVREFFPDTREYLGIDLGMAPCVDWVVPGELVELPDHWADITVSTECFEHCNNWKQVFLNMIRITSIGGLVIITCAGIGRDTHGTIDSEEDSSPFTTSYYRNLCVDDICNEISLACYFIQHGFEVNSVSRDLYFWGIRSDSIIKGSDHYWEEPLARLARAQGQLGQAAARHAAIQAAYSLSLSEVERLRSQAEELRHAHEDLHQYMQEVESSRSWKAVSRLRNALASLKEIRRRYLSSTAAK
jgi:hypothetical protein